MPISIRDMKFEHEYRRRSHLFEDWQDLRATHSHWSANTPISCEDRRQETVEEGAGKRKEPNLYFRSFAEGLELWIVTIRILYPRRMDDAAKYKINYLTHCCDADERSLEYWRVALSLSNWMDFHTEIGLNQDRISENPENPLDVFIKFNVFAAAKHVAVLDRYSNLTRGHSSFVHVKQLGTKQLAWNVITMQLWSIPRVQQQRD